MSGLSELGGLYGFQEAGQQVSQANIDQYDQVAVNYPSVDGSFLGTASGTTTAANTAIVKKNILMDWPRNVKYAVNGITAGTYGGTFTASYIDQFGVAVNESVTVPAASNGGTVFGTVIAFQFLGGSFTSQGSAGTFIGTASIGAGTGIGTGGNYFGLLSKIAGTADIILVRYTDNGAVSILGGGSLIGSNINAANHSFQGTGGVKVTDAFTVIFKPTYDNTGKGTMANL